MNNEKARKKDSARLVWDSKPRRSPNPKDIEFQTAEVVIPNPAHRDELPLSFRDGLLGEADIDKQKMNRLIWGDNLLAMQALLSQGYEGKINLIYIDPPFDSRADYSYNLTIEGSEFRKEPSVIERLAYKDTWVGGTDSYLDMLYPRLQLMKRLLAEDGVLFLHLDWHVGHYVKAILDEVFGRENFRNEIVRIKCNPKNYTSKAFGNIHDVIFLYSKTEEYFFKRIFTERDPNEVEVDFPLIEKESGRRYKTAPLHGRGESKGITGKPWRGLMPPKGNHWRYTPGELDRLDGDGRIEWSATGNPRKKIYANESPGRAVQDIWMGFKDTSRSEFETQKNAKLLHRIISAGSPDGGIIADLFAGSGTTGTAAEQLGRRWIMCELGKVGIQVSRTRLVEMGAKPFLIENIGNYQREMIYLTGGRIWEMQHLILKLYGATPRDKASGLGVRKASDEIEELVYVGYPDRPVSAKKAEQLAFQAQKLDGKGYKRLVILGWDYEYNYHQALEARKKALKDKLNIQIESRDIPPDIYDYLKEARSEEDIESLADKVQFYERPYVRLSKPETRELTDGKVQIKIGITRYVLMDIPVSRTTKKDQESYERLMKLAKDNFAVLIDYWAVDWDYDGCTFKSQWQAFRGNGRKAKTVPIEALETLEKKKKRTIAVRVVDIFGNDAGATLEMGS